VLFLTYEDMVKNLSSIVKTVAQFLNVDIPTERMPEVLKYLSFDQMKLNPHSNRDAATDKLIQIHGVQRKTNFIRKGKIGSWKEELDEESIKKLDKWNAKNGIPTLLAKLSSNHIVHESSFNGHFRFKNWAPDRIHLFAIHLAP